MTEEAREAAWQEAHDTWTLESGEPLSEDELRMSDAFFAAGVTEGIRQAREAVAGLNERHLAMCGGLAAIDALEVEG